ncbi:MAG: pantoate--beta-alanine ligase [Bacteroidota bacterium]
MQSFIRLLIDNMDVFQTKNELQDKIIRLKQKNYSIGFVPTMGALHEGHLSLVECCNKENDITVVSIFVNPAQFNDREDYEKYPRDVQKDIDWLEEFDCDIVFNPSESEMYPEPDNRTFDFGELDKILEGYYRPGHFNGVAKVVSKLFDYVRPHKAYFGEKDFQQLAIIRQLTEQENMDIDIIGCPIIREEDGLAMSSRNERLNSEERKNAAEISRVLFESREKKDEMTVEEIKNRVKNQLNKNVYINVEYFDIVDEKNFKTVQTWRETQNIRGVIAAWVGNIRLIDNIKYE